MKTKYKPHDRAAILDWLRYLRAGDSLSVAKKNAGIGTIQYRDYRKDYPTIRYIAKRYGQAHKGLKWA